MKRPKESNCKTKHEYVYELDKYQKAMNGKDSKWILKEIERLTEYYLTLKKIFQV